MLPAEEGDWVRLRDAYALARPTIKKKNDEIDRLKARLAEEQMQHCETLNHNAEIGTALTEARARLAKAEAYIEALEQNLNDFVDLKTMDEAVAWRATGSAAAHVHTDECWEPDSGCDMGRNEEFVRAACQSQAGGEIAWRDGLINEAKELLKVMPDRGLSARDFALWNRRRALFLGLHLWVGPYGAVRWTHCQTCGAVQRADGKNGPCRGPSRISTREDDVAVHTSHAEREVARMIKDHASIIANKGKACVFCGAIGGEHHLSTCRAEGDKPDGATSTVSEVPHE
jgi:hypothetical protein